MIVKIHKTHDGRTVLAICDSGLRGKKIEEGDLQLDLTSKFYNGEETDRETLLKMLPKADSLNIVGEESIKFALEHRLIAKDNIRYVNKVPFAMCLFDASPK
jgi:hypothetical protein